MSLRAGLAKALASARKSKGIPQEGFSAISSRTYVSTLERGLKSPTVDKLDGLCHILDVHPVSLLFAAYVLAGSSEPEELQRTIAKEVDQILKFATERGQV
ncbi:helix-turn-helix domain-containing protein [Noviherbaspirillum suwonense]|uniref:helix-turn-helix domain-containing protein n=1 Tax=Noviherbaspirillum suwonense TaxID=1224511 RepID=UPI0024B872E4|nr:helix-turn-helix transcriptional regulator [Noviherbaspirillum suwonense]